MATRHSGKYVAMEPRRMSFKMAKLDDSDSAQHLMLEAQETSYSRATTPNPDDRKQVDDEDDSPVRLITSVETIFAN